MPLGVLVTLANPGAIATSDLFRRFEITDLNINNHNNDNNKEEKRPLEKFPFDGKDSFKRIPLGNEVPLDGKDIFQHQYSSLYDSSKLISRLRKMITSYGGSRKRSRSDNHIKNSKKSYSNRIRFDSSITNSLSVPSNRTKTVSSTGTTLSSISSSSSSSSLSSYSDDSSPFDIINKPLIFSIPGL